MDLRSQQRVQAQSRADAAPTASSYPSTPRSLRGDKGGLGTKKVILGGIAALVVIGLILGALWMTNPNPLSSVKKDQYQAVFLTNGQVYFGKVKSISGSNFTLSDIYYLQQADVQKQQTDDQEQSAQNQLSLAKLGKELHGPEDVMFIERSQVLFWENLKADSQVVKTIQQEKQQNQ